jgi:hypothetical protein
VQPSDGCGSAAARPSVSRAPTARSAEQPHRALGTGPRVGRPQRGRVTVVVLRSAALWFAAPARLVFSWIQAPLGGGPSSVAARTPRTGTGVMSSHDGLEARRCSSAVCRRSACARMTARTASAPTAKTCPTWSVSGLNTSQRRSTAPSCGRPGRQPSGTPVLALAPNRLPRTREHTGRGRQGAFRGGDEWRR